VMRIFAESNYSTRVLEKGRRFLSLLRDLQSGHPEIGDVGGLGLALRIEICERDGFTPNRALADRMFQRGLRGDLHVGGRTLGLVLDVGGYYKNVLTLAPSLDITEEEMSLAHDLLDLLIRECREP
jgi:4-aminobutyrate aminotransferase / (S)-3-amino-2-methylpropionate transaminase / 5-aminovalerate transaminase